MENFIVVAGCILVGLIVLAGTVLSWQHSYSPRRIWEESRASLDVLLRNDQETRSKQINIQQAVLTQLERHNELLETQNQVLISLLDRLSDMRQG